MVGERRRWIEIDAFLWDYSDGSNVDHIALHGVTPNDVEEVSENQPHFFDARPGYEGYVMLGPNRRGRYLYVAMFEIGTQVSGR
ncbi:MAG: hypothetical protein GEU75_11100 [Dehalococcoidia bacterium]|nr:hypothetical protein [Dehalococcoidia bacterium]